MLDDTDRRIIEVLERDARTSLRGIAEEVGVSLGTVSNLSLIHISEPTRRS